jgi:hypothetical protein
MGFSLNEFSEDAAFELLTLSLLGSKRVRLPRPDRVYHLENAPAGGSSISVTIFAPPAGGARPTGDGESPRALAAVAFLTAFKVLDLLVEHVIRANGGPTGKPGFATKIKWLKANKASLLPTPLVGNSAVWDRFQSLFCDLADGVRGGVAHRRVQVVGDELVVYDHQHPRQELDRLGAAEIAAFVAAIHTLAELVVEQTADERRMSLVAAYLNELRSRHGLADLPASIDPQADVWLLIVDLRRLDANSWRFDAAHARTVIERQGPADVWDLELRAGPRVFSARWERIPTGESHDIATDDPPPWIDQALA